MDKARFSGIDYAISHNPDGACMFVDSDDYIEPDSMRLLMEAMQRTDSDVVQMKTNRVFGFIKRPYYSPLKAQTIKQPELFENYYISFFGINIIDVNMCFKLYRTSVIAKAGLSPTGFKMGEDLMFNLRLFPYLHKYTIIDYRGYNYRVGGLTTSYNPHLWDDLKQQYQIKLQEAAKHNYTKALIPSTIELANILISAISQRIIYIRESDNQLTSWVNNVVSDKKLWLDSILGSPDGIKNEKLRAIRNEDSAFLINLAKKQVSDTRYRRAAKKILSLFFK